MRTNDGLLRSVSAMTEPVRPEAPMINTVCFRGSAISVFVLEIAGARLDPAWFYRRLHHRHRL